MTELDLINLARETTDSAALYFMNFVTVLFAFVAASHFAGPALSRLNVGIILFVFTIFTFATGVSAFTRGRQAGA